MKKISLILLLSLITFAEKPKEYPRFIGKFFNGLYYPRVNIIEWDDAPRTYYEFHVYQKKDIPSPIDIGFAFKPDVEGTNPKMLINYNIKNRSELLCRHAPIPEHFQKGGFKFYVDRSNPEYDNFMLTMDADYLVKHMEKKGRKLQELPLSEYKECKEELTQDDLPKSEEKKPDVKKSDENGKKENSMEKKIDSENPSGDGGVESNAW